MKLPDQLRAWRRRENIPQHAAASRLGVPLKTLQNWEQGVRTPRGLALQRLRELITKK